MFINTVPVRVRRRRRDAGVAAWLRELQAAQAEARRFDFVSLAQLHGVERACPAGVSLFDSIVVFENYPIDDAAAAGARPAAARRAGGATTTNYPLDRGRLPRRAAVGSTLGYDPALFDAGHRASGSADQLLDAADRARPRTPTGRCGALPWLAGASGDRMLVEWNGTARELPAGDRSWTLFAAQAARTPDAVAVMRRRHALTYAELRRAGQPAGPAAASRAGAGPERCVGAARCRARPTWSWRCWPC